MSSSSSGAAAAAGETEARARALAERMAEVARILANEPSLALYRIEEHVRKTVPRLAGQRADVVKLDRDIAGHVTDVDCVLSTLRSIGRSRASFQSVSELAKNALFLKQQLDYERRRRTVTSSVADAIKRSGADVVSRLSIGGGGGGGEAELATSAPAAADAPSSPAGGNGPAAMLESAKTFLRSKTLDYSQNLMRRAQATKSVEIPSAAGGGGGGLPPPMPPLPHYSHQQQLQPHQAPPMPPRPPHRSSSAQVLKPVSETGEEVATPPAMTAEEADCDASVETSEQQQEHGQLHGVADDTGT